MNRSRQKRLELLRLSIMEVPWEPKGREIVIAEMERLGMSNDDLFVALRNARWQQSYSTVGRWMRGQSEPSVTEVGLLTDVLMDYSADGTIPGFLNSPDDVALSIPVMADCAA